MTATCVVVRVFGVEARASLRRLSTQPQRVRGSTLPLLQPRGRLGGRLRRQVPSSAGAAEVGTGSVLHLVGKGNKPATMPITVQVLRVLEACRGQRTRGRLILRPVSGEPIDRRDVYRMVARMVARMAKAAGTPRHISPHSLRHAAITNALDAGVPLRDAQILARHADPRTIEHYDRARGNLERHGVHFLTAYVAGV
ncbi:site-specific integrase [Intrasporangium calvum]|uniref:tyrosine-type recombinase/integrase n=1 Tax=Intrasporangium calvum TaxID=53358 RepID=UPI002FF2499C